MPMIGRRITPGLHRAAWGFMQSGDFPVPVLWLKFGENTGTEAKDSSPEGNDGAIEGATWTTGHLGPGLDFDGLDDHIKVDKSTSLDITGSALTIIAIVNLTAMSGSEAIRRVISKRAGSDLWNISVHRGLTYWYTELTTSDDDYSKTVSEVLSGWNQLAIVYDGSYLRAYTDGALTTREAATGTIDSIDADVYIGSEYGTGRFCDGIIDEVLIFDVALTAAQIRQLYYGYR